MWMLVTPRSAEAQVNQRFSQLQLDGPADFPVLSLALHKLDFEQAEYRKETATMARIELSLEQQVEELINLQRDFGRELHELRSRSGLQFQRKLAVAGAEIADYRQTIGLLKQLRRTFVMNRANYLINAVSLVSASEKQRVARSIDQENVAAQVIVGLQQDHVFAPDIGHFQYMCRQLDADIDYGEAKVERLSASLRAASDQLQIAGQRELGEMAHHLSIDSAAVVASIAAIIGTELFIKGQELQNVPAHRILLSIFLVAAAFATTVVLSGGRKGGALERGSIAFAIFWLGGTLSAWGLFYMPEIHLTQIWMYTLSMSLGLIPAGLAWLTYRWLQSHEKYD
jgi:hypothetical protein